MPATEVEVLGVRVEVHIAHQRHDLQVHADLVLIADEVLAQLGRHRVDGGHEGLQVAVLVDELGGGLLPHPLHAWQVVRRIAAHGGVEHVVRRLHAGSLENPGLVVERVVADATAVVEHADVGVLDELVAVTVAGDDDDRVLLVTRAGGERGDHVVGLVALAAHHRNG